MRNFFYLIFIVMFSSVSGSIAQSEQSISASGERINDIIKFVAMDFTSSLGTFHSVLPAQRFVVVRKLDNGSSDLIKIVYFPQRRIPVSESFLVVEPRFYEKGVEAVLRKPSNSEVQHCSFSNFIDVDNRKIDGRKNDKTLRFLSVEYKASMMFEFEQMSCFVLESVVSEEKKINVLETQVGAFNPTNP